MTVLRAFLGILLRIGCSWILIKVIISTRLTEECTARAMIRTSPAAIQRNVLSSPRNSVWLASLETIAGLSIQTLCGIESQDPFLKNLPHLKCWKAKLSRKGKGEGQYTSKHRVTYVFL